MTSQTKESTEPHNITSDPTPDKPTTEKSSISGHSFKSLLTGSQSAQLQQLQLQHRDKQTNKHRRRRRRKNGVVGIHAKD